MSDRSVGVDERGVSEAFALAILVGMVVVTTGAVGIYVLVADGGEGAVAVNFSYQYFDDTDAVLITHARGESIAAGDIRIEGPGDAVTWAEAANDPEDEPVATGDAVQLSSGNVYGAPVLTGDTFRVYRIEAGNSTQLSKWTAG